MNKGQQFKALHQQTSPLLIGNVWDCQSALMFESLGYQAIGTSSGAIANSLGYEDGEQMTFEELHVMIKLILSKTSIPLTVDLEGGYSRNINQIIENITTLHRSGVVGVNLEDSVVSKNREMLSPQDFGKTIKKIRSYLKENETDLFLNIRTDAYIIGIENPLEETLSRMKIYEEAGADGIFIPCITKTEELEAIVQATSLPVNVMAMPDLPSFDTLQQCGVKRISMGPFVYNYINEKLKNILTSIEKDQSFNPLFVTK